MFKPKTHLRVTRGATPDFFPSDLTSRPCLLAYSRLGTCALALRGCRYTTCPPVPIRHLAPTGTRLRVSTTQETATIAHPCGAARNCGLVLYPKVSGIDRRSFVCHRGSVPPACLWLGQRGRRLRLARSTETTLHYFIRIYRRTASSIS
jgi:hypothetical protein